jgi:hypothetical protein
MTPLESVSSKSGAVLFLSLVIIAWTFLRESDVAHAMHMSCTDMSAGRDWRRADRERHLAGLDASPRTGGALYISSQGPARRAGIVNGAEESARSRPGETRTAQQLRSGWGQAGVRALPSTVSIIQRNIAAVMMLGIRRSHRLVTIKWSTSGMDRP